MGRIRRDVAACRVPLNAAPDELTAINQIQALPAFQTIFAHTFLGSGTPFGDWFDEMATLIANDHDTHGPCEDAEESVVRPLVNAINERAVEQRWVGSPGSDTRRHRSRHRNQQRQELPRHTGADGPEAAACLAAQEGVAARGTVGVSDDLPGGSTRRRPGCPFGRPGVCRLQADHRRPCLSVPNTRRARSRCEPVLANKEKEGRKKK